MLKKIASVSLWLIASVAPAVSTIWIPIQTIDPVLELISGVLIALGIVKFTPNKLIEKITYDLCLKVDLWGESKFGARWAPIENSILASIKTMAEAASKAFTGKRL